MFKRSSVIQSCSSSDLVCADCSAADPTWASINRGVLVCDECCSVHRCLGRHISHIRSLHSSWPQSQKEMVNVLVQKGANSIWEHALHDSSINLKSKPKKPGPKDKLNPTKHDFIVAKYKHLAYIPRFTRDKDDLDAKDDLNRQLHASVRTSNLETCLRLISLGADVNYFNTNKGSAPLHIASQAGQSMQVELLIAHGANPCVLDRLGHMADECARIAGHHQLADRLIECQYELSDKLSEFLCSRRPQHSMGEHFLIPKDEKGGGSSCSSSSLPTSTSDAANKLQELTNKLFEELTSDVYDEVDRRETDSLWLTTQQQQSSVAFLPVNPLLTPLRNQGRQKLATLDDKEFRQLLIDILIDTKRRQTLAVNKTGDQSGTAVPSEDIEMPQHDYDDVPVQLAISPGAKDEDETYPYELPVASPKTILPEAQKLLPGDDAEKKYAELLEKYEERGLEISKLRRIIHQLELDLTQAKQELEAVRSGKKVRKPSDTGYSAITDTDDVGYAEVGKLLSPSETDGPFLEQDRGSHTERTPSPFSHSSKEDWSLPTSPKLLEPTGVNPGYARVDLNKKTLERKQKAEVEMRKESMSGEPNKEQITACVNKISKHIHSLVEAAKLPGKEQIVQRFEEHSNGVCKGVSDLAMLFPEKPNSIPVQESLRNLVLGSQSLRTQVQDCDRDLTVLIESVIGSARDVVKAAQALNASLENSSSP